MAKKALKKKVQAKPAAGKLGENVVDSAREIWLAGLGAFSYAQQEGKKLVEEGNKLFDKLVEEGAKLEKYTRGAAGDKVVDFRGDMEHRVEAVRQQAQENWDKLEKVFEDRVARVLGRLGVPTADDVNKLSARVQKLSKQVEALGEKPVARKTSARKKTATRKKAAAKKTAAK